MELLDVFAELVLGNPGEISVSGLPDIKVFVHVIELSLLPSVLNVPIQLSICSFLNFFLVFEAVCVISVLPVSALMPFEVSPGA